MTFGAYIRDLRTSLHLSQSEVADAVKIPQSYLSALERGKKTNPSKDVIQGLAGLYKVPFEDLAARVWADGVEPQTLPLAGLPPFLVALGKRVGPLLTDRDWHLVADILERLAEERAATQSEAPAAYGYQVPESDQAEEQAPGQKTA